jgi:hypothetical protein
MTSSLKNPRSSAYFPLPLGEGGVRANPEPGTALAAPRPPDAEVKTAIEDEVGSKVRRPCTALNHVVERQQRLGKRR